MNGDGFDLQGPWRTAAEQIVRNLTTSIDPRDLELPGGPLSAEGIERYAREYCAASGRSNLAVIYAIASVGVCVATQGAWVAQIPLAGGGYLSVPAIQYATPIAPSGWRKSTALDVARKVLLRVLTEGVRTRTERLAGLRQVAMTRAQDQLAQSAAGARVDPKQFADVFTAGICPVTLVKDPTMEALGQMLVNNGGVGGILDAEANVFRAMTAYTNGEGNLAPLLDGWSQEGISTARVGRGIVEMHDVALNLLVMFQAEVFADVTGGAGARNSGTDSFISRGFFGRCWVVRATNDARYEELADRYGDDTDFEYHGPDGLALPDGVPTPLGEALTEYEKNLRSLVQESNVYRMNKALHRAWEQGMVEHGADLQVPEPEMPQRHEIHLNTAAARLAYRRVQRMQLFIESALNDPRVDPDVRDVFLPLAARFTQHVLREALTVQLGAGRRVLSARAIEDAATRLVPWRIAHTADALLFRAVEVTDQAIREAAVSNPTGADLSTEGAVLRQLIRLAQNNPSAAKDGFTRGQVREAVRGTLRRVRGTGAGMGDVVNTALEALVAQPHTGVVRLPDSIDGRGFPVARYGIDQRALRANP